MKNLQSNLLVGLILTAIMALGLFLGAVILAVSETLFNSLGTVTGAAIYAAVAVFAIHKLSRA